MSPCLYAGDVRQGDFPRFLDGTYALGAPVYAIAGAYEDVAVLAKMRSGQYKVPNLHMLDETHSVLIAPNLRYNDLTFPEVISVCRWFFALKLMLAPWLQAVWARRRH